MTYEDGKKKINLKTGIDIFGLTENDRPKIPKQADRTYEII